MNVLEQQLERLQAGLRASHISLLVYSGDAEQRQIGLFHSGSTDPVPELADANAASSLIAGSLASRRSERFPSKDPQCQLISIPTRAEGGQPTQERRQFIPQEPSYWMGIRGLSTSELTAQLPVIEAIARLAGKLFALEQSRADPQTGLPDRAEFERSLRLQLTEASRDKLSLSVLLLANENATQSATMLPIAIHDLGLALRDTDRLYRYSIDQLALIVSGLQPEDLQLLSDKIQQTLGSSSHDSGSQNPWAIAAVRYNAATLGLTSALEISLAAETVLRQCLSRGPVGSDGVPLVLLQMDGSLVNEEVDPTLNVVFSGETTRDYRHMRLLWDTVNRLGEQGSATELAADMTHLLGERLGVSAALLQIGRTGADVLATTTQLQNPLPEALWLSLKRLNAGVHRDALTVTGQPSRWLSPTALRLVPSSYS